MLVFLPTLSQETRQGWGNLQTYFKLKLALSLYGG